MDKSHFEHAAYALALLVVGYFLGFAELALGLASVAQEAYVAGQEAERQQKQPVQVDDVDIIEAT